LRCRRDGNSIPCCALDARAGPASGLRWGARQGRARAPAAGGQRPAGAGRRAARAGPGPRLQVRRVGQQREVHALAGRGGPVVAGAQVVLDVAGAHVVVAQRHGAGELAEDLRQRLADHVGEHVQAPWRGGRVLSARRPRALNLPPGGLNSPPGGRAAAAAAALRPTNASSLQAVPASRAPAAAPSHEKRVRPGSRGGARAARRCGASAVHRLGRASRAARTHGARAASSRKRLTPATVANACAAAPAPAPAHPKGGAPRCGMPMQMDSTPDSALRSMSAFMPGMSASQPWRAGGAASARARRRRVAAQAENGAALERRRGPVATQRRRAAAASVPGSASTAKLSPGRRSTGAEPSARPAQRLRARRHQRPSGGPAAPARARTSRPKRLAAVYLLARNDSNISLQASRSSVCSLRSGEYRFCCAAQRPRQISQRARCARSAPRPASLHARLRCGIARCMQAHARARSAAAGYRRRRAPRASSTAGPPQR